MKNEIIKNLIHRLTAIDPNDSPLISCFVNLEHPRGNYFTEVESQARLLAQRLRGKRREDYLDALDEVRDYLGSKLRPEARSVAIYARWGDHPFFLPMQFEVPLKTQFMVDALPHVYPLIELKDTYHRFVIVITTETEARILETTVGTVTEEILASRPELRERIGREWTREHYHNHKHEREQQFIREKVRIVDELMNRRGHNHLIVAGSPKMVGRMTQALPERLKRKLVSTLSSNPRSRGISPILLESIERFTEAENRESHDRVRELESAVFSDGLGVVGYEACARALQEGYADQLIVDQDLDDEEMREALVRQATRANVPVETVSGSEALERLGGAGCLLRFRPDWTVGTKIEKAA